MSELVGGNEGLVWETPNSWESDQKGALDSSAGAAAAAAAAATKENTEEVVARPKKRCAEQVDESDHKIHIWTERERRKKMRNMFSNLHALLPQLPPKADKSRVVDEAVSYIRSLENTLEKLQKEKVERQVGGLCSREAFLADQGSCTSSSICSCISTRPPPGFGGSAVVFQTWTSPNVILNVCGDDAHISICSSAKKHGLFTAIFYVFERHRLEVVSAQVSSHNGTTIYMIQAHARASNELAETLTPVEEIYKQAAAEMIVLVNPGEDHIINEL